MRVNDKIAELNVKIDSLEIEVQELKDIINSHVFEHESAQAHTKYDEY